MPSLQDHLAKLRKTALIKATVEKPKRMTLRFFMSLLCDTEDITESKAASILRQQKYVGGAVDIVDFCLRNGVSQGAIDYAVSRVIKKYGQDYWELNRVAPVA
jgi:hypothetical protein